MLFVFEIYINLFFSLNLFDYWIINSTNVMNFLMKLVRILQRNCLLTLFVKKWFRNKHFLVSHVLPSNIDRDISTIAHFKKKKQILAILAILMNNYPKYWYKYTGKTVTKMCHNVSLMEFFVPKNVKLYKKHNINKSAIYILNQRNHQWA